MNIRLHWADEPYTEDHGRLEAEHLASLTADVTPADRSEGAELGWITTQGRPEQAWPARRCSPEMACWAPDDDAPRDAMTGNEALLLTLIYAASVGFVAWLLAVLCAFFFGG